MLGWRMKYIYHSHLIWLMHSDLFQWDNTFSGCRKLSLGVTIMLFIDLFCIQG